MGVIVCHSGGNFKHSSSQFRLRAVVFLPVLPLHKEFAAQVINGEGVSIYDSCGFVDERSSPQRIGCAIL